MANKGELIMGREVRRVPADWQHPDDEALFDGAEYQQQAREWDEGEAAWSRGEFPDYADEEDKKSTWAEWAGDRPNAAHYMPQWTAEEATHYMMYENTSEGTPISPAFATPEELAQWLVDNNASSFANQTASYEGWLRVAKGGYAPSAVISASGVASGVEALKEA